MSDRRLCIVLLAVGVCGSMSFMRVDRDAISEIGIERTSCYGFCLQAHMKRRGR